MKKYLWITGLLFIAIFTGCESMQKSVYDKKADMIGTDRTISLYSWDGKLIKSFSDKAMRFESSPDGKSISVWLGKKNKKVFTNMFYIVEDN